jgi:uracil-DNA glycosylase
MPSVAREMMLREMGVAPIWKSRVQSINNASEESVAQPAAQKLRSYETIDNPQPPITLDIAERNAHIAQMTWNELVTEIAQCTACKLCSTRKNTVPGVGNIHPKWMVVGEAPGENEDKKGEPFVGRAGQLLDAMLLAAGKSRKRDVFITNTVKCRPPGNRDPDADETAACSPFLNRQIELAKPKLLLALGKFAGHQLLDSNVTVAAMRAAPGVRNGVPVVVTYHPSYLLRAPIEKEKTWGDLVAAIALTPEH